MDRWQASKTYKLHKIDLKIKQKYINDTIDKYKDVTILAKVILLGFKLERNSVESYIEYDENLRRNNKPLCGCWCDTRTWWTD